MGACCGSFEDKPTEAELQEARERDVIKAAKEGDVKTLKEVLRVMPERAHDRDTVSLHACD